MDEHNARQVDYYDGIQLVQNSSTAFFAFHNSYDDTYYEDNFIMIDGATIDERYPEEPSVAGMFFVGFDYEHNKTKMGENDIEKRDYYFNDWVIRVSPGFYRNSQRIMVEDLIATNLSQLDKSDWDFNDAVFDVAFVSENGWDAVRGNYEDKYAIVTLWAAGGTKNLTIDGNEVHELFGQPVSKMINTNANNGIDGLQPVIFRIKEPGTINAKDIVVKVDGIVLDAPQGKAPQKVEVSNTTKWMKESVIITEGYAKFAEYATENTPANWYETVTDASRLY
jgi:hypothetical protein